MRKYENPELLQENRLPQRSYYIPENDGAYMSLNGEWSFSFFLRDFDAAPQKSGTIDVPSCWRCSWSKTRFCGIRKSRTFTACR